jgi:hypothetical protein
LVKPEDESEPEEKKKVHCLKIKLIHMDYQICTCVDRESPFPNVKEPPPPALLRNLNVHCDYCGRYLSSDCSEDEEEYHESGGCVERDPLPNPDGWFSDSDQG